MTKTTELSAKQKAHKAKMAKHKAKVDANIAAAQTERGVAILMTGNGKGKTSSAMGMVIRALGYGQKVGVVQFIKGAQNCGEGDFIKANCPTVDFEQMGTGLYLDKDIVVDAIQARPKEQSVVVTGRGGGRKLRSIMDTISDVKDVRHGYRNGLKARKGVDY